jgi:hypothetical protein
MIVDLKFKSPSCFIITGGSGSGKTVLIKNMLLQHKECFEKPFTELHFIYAQHTEDKTMFRELEEKLPITFHMGYPEEKINDGSLFTSTREDHKCLIIDDIFTEPKQCRSLINLYSIMSHHMNITVIVTIQNMSSITGTQRACISTLLRSTHYLIMFASRRMMPVARQVALTYFPGEKEKVLKPFQYLLASKIPYCYLLIDFETLNECMQIREGGCVPEHECHGFVLTESLH